MSGERKSGFLFPSIGNSSTGGFQLSLPYYWNIAPNADFTFEPKEYTKRGVDLGGDLRFLTERQHGELDWNYLPYDSNFGASRSRVRLNEVAELHGGVRLDGQRRERERHGVTSRTSPRGRKGRVPRS